MILRHLSLKYMISFQKPMSSALGRCAAQDDDGTLPTPENALRLGRNGKTPAAGAQPAARQQLAGSIPSEKCQMQGLCQARWTAGAAAPACRNNGRPASFIRGKVTPGRGQPVYG